MKKEEAYIVGVAGGSASGKTTFIRQLNEKFGPHEICVISQDNYYKPLSEQAIDKNGEVNFDLPEGIDFERLVKDVKRLRKGHDVSIVEYTFNNPEIFPKEIVFKASPIIIIEGLFIYADPELSKLFDLKLFIDASVEVMLNRRLKRDAKERGMTKNQIVYQWEEHVLPAYTQYLEPYKKDMDMLIMNNNHFKNSFNVMVDHFLTRLNKWGA